MGGAEAMRESDQPEIFQLPPAQEQAIRLGWLGFTQTPKGVSDPSKEGKLAELITKIKKEKVKNALIVPNMASSRITTTLIKREVLQWNKGGSLNDGLSAHEKSSPFIALTGIKFTHSMNRSWVQCRNGCIPMSLGHLAILSLYIQTDVEYLGAPGTRGEGGIPLIGVESKSNQKPKVVIHPFSLHDKDEAEVAFVTYEKRIITPL